MKPLNLISILAVAILLIAARSVPSKVNGQFYIENCNSLHINLCGNYFEQNLMRLPVLIKRNDTNFLKSYDTIYVMTNDQLMTISSALIDQKHADSLMIRYPETFQKSIKRFLKRNKLKEGVKDNFTYSELHLEFDPDRIEPGEIIIPNPKYTYRSKSDIFISIRTTIIHITNLGIKPPTHESSEITSLTIDALGNYIQ